jgi:branched-chain amino acid transport system permease protein
MGLMDFANLAHGTFAMVGGYLASVAMNQFGVPFLATLVLGFVAGALSGGVIEVLFIRHHYRSHPLDQVLLTIGIVFVSIAAATYVMGPNMQPFRLPAFLQGNLVVAGAPVRRYGVFLILVGVVVIVALQLLVNRTRFGAMVRAAVDNRRVAGGTGINVQRLFFYTFAFGSGLAGFGGALGLGMLAVTPVFPLEYTVYFLMVVCAGGAGTIMGPFWVALLFGLVDTAGKYFIPQTGAFLVYLLVLAVLLLRPNGLIAKRGLV